jgi:hypothetical protein
MVRKKGKKLGFERIEIETLSDKENISLIKILENFIIKWGLKKFMDYLQDRQAGTSRC